MIVDGTGMDYSVHRHILSYVHEYEIFTHVFHDLSHMKIMNMKLKLRLKRSASGISQSVFIFHL